MLNTILKEFAINGDNCEKKPIGNGLINETWKITHGNDEYVLQKVNTDVFKKPEEIDENLAQLKSYLNNNFPDYIFVAPVESINGNTLIENNGGCYRLFHYVVGSITINSVSNSTQAFEAAKQFGKFSKLLSGFDASKLNTTIPDFHNLQLRYHQFKIALKNASNQRLENAEEPIKAIEKNIDILDNFLAIQEGKITIPTRVIHHDTKISNVLFDENGKGLCVIDLDTVMPGYYLSDVGDMMRSYLSPASEEVVNFEEIVIRKDIFTAIHQGYMSEMNDILSETEKNMFFYAGKFIIYMQAVRFLTDYLNNDVYYGAKYEDHNLNRAKNQIKLLKEYITSGTELEIVSNDQKEILKFN